MLTHRAPRFKTIRTASMVEMIVGVVVGLIVIMGGLSYYLVIVRSNALLVHDARLAHELSGTLRFVADELRRAGYQPIRSKENALNDTDTGSPFMAVDARLTILEGGNCILYTYDRNENDKVDPHEFFGFRLRDFQIETRISGGTTLDCNDGHWNTLTDARITLINELVFEDRQFTCLNSRTGAMWKSHCDDVTANGYGLPASDDALNETRQVRVSVAGSLANDNFLTWQAYQQTVQLRNHRYLGRPHEH